MKAWSKTTTVVCCAILMLTVGCTKEKELPPQHAKQSPTPLQASECIVKDGLVVSINGTKVNYPDSEKLNWVAAKDSNSVDPELVALGFSQESPAIRSNHIARITRYATINEYLLLCGGFDPPFPDGSFCWVVSTKDKKYIGHFLDKDSR